MTAQSPEERPVQILPFAQFFMEFDPSGQYSYELGATPSGQRSIGLITSGWIDGDRLKGRILVGMDYGIRRPDDTHVPDIGLMCETHDGDQFLASYTGLIEPLTEVQKALHGEPHDPDIINWKCFMTFQTSAPAIDWLNRTQVVARGSVVEGGIHYWAYQLD
jgi:Protein of unknown function (DUF3237)